MVSCVLTNEFVPKDYNVRLEVNDKRYEAFPPPFYLFLLKLS